MGREDLTDIARSEDQSALRKVTFESEKGIKTDKMKVELKNPGELLEWHPGAGGETFIFIDEIKLD